MKKLLLILLVFVSIGSFCQTTTRADKIIANDTIKVSGTAIGKISTDSTLADNSDKELVTQKAIKTYVLHNGGGGMGGSTDTSSLSNRINLRIKYSDTASMLSAYQSAINGNTSSILSRVKYSDTASMLAAYQSALNARVMYSDSTVKYVTPTQLGNSGYIKGNGIIGAIPYYDATRQISYTSQFTIDSLLGLVYFNWGKTNNLNLSSQATDPSSPTTGIGMYAKTANGITIPYWIDSLGKATRIGTVSPSSKNTTGNTIAAYTPVCLDSTSSIAVAKGNYLKFFPIGITQDAIANNGYGRIVYNGGIVTGINLSAYQPGTRLYLADNGGITATPSTTYPVVMVGVVTGNTTPYSLLVNIGNVPKDSVNAATYVPYTGAGASVNLGTNNLTANNLTTTAVTSSLLKTNSSGTLVAATAGASNDYLAGSSLSATRNVSTGSIFTYNSSTGAYNLDTTKLGGGGITGNGTPSGQLMPFSTWSTANSKLSSSTVSYGNYDSTNHNFNFGTTTPQSTYLLNVNGAAAATTLNGLTLSQLGASSNLYMGNLNGGNGGAAGTYNMSIGYGGMRTTNSSSQYNIGIGANNFYNLTSGTNNVSIMPNNGAYNLTTGVDNTFINSGPASNVSYSTGIGGSINANYATAIGWNSYSTLNGVSLGYNAGYNSSGNYTNINNNVFVGYEAGLSSIAANNTIIIGNYGNSPTAYASTYNTFIGNSQNLYNVGSYNTVIGAQIQPRTNGSNEVILGDGAGNQRLNIFSTGNAMLGYGNNPTDDATNKLQVNGSIKATQYRLSALNTAPASSSDTGTTGEIRITASYIYICTATNTWVRAALSTW